MPDAGSNHVHLAGDQSQYKRTKIHVDYLKFHIKLLRHIAGNFDIKSDDIL